MKLGAIRVYLQPRITVVKLPFGRLLRTNDKRFHYVDSQYQLRVCRLFPCKSLCVVSSYIVVLPPLRKASAYHAFQVRRVRDGSARDCRGGDTERCKEIVGGQMDLDEARTHYILTTS